MESDYSTHCARSGPLGRAVRHKSMGEHKSGRISKEAENLISCVIPLLDHRKVNFELKEIDLSHFESISYEITIKTRPESGLKLVLHLFRDAVGLFCNDHQIRIYLSEKPTDSKTWTEYLPKIITAIFRPELRIRTRRSFLSGKNAAIWLELPGGSRWMGDEKTSKGSGKEQIFRDWY